MGIEVTATRRMMPIVRSSAILSGKTVNANGRVLTAVAGTPVDAVGHDVHVMSANNWISVGGRSCIGVGTTAQRPTNTPSSPIEPGSFYADTTLGNLSIFDGTTWRNPVTGALV